MLHLDARIGEAAATLKRLWDGPLSAGIILGTGLGGFIEHIDVEQTVPYSHVPHLPQSTADGHHGQLVCGCIAGAPVITIDGRCHAYEGYSLDEITMPVRLMKALGIQLLILTNAAGGMNPHYRSGDIMVIEDHINLIRLNQRTRDRDAGLAPRTETGCPYCPRLIERALAAARRAGFTAHRGVYAAVAGPNYETRAEYRFLRSVGADAVGMSTAPEAIVAAQCGLRVLAFSTITNICLPDRLTPARHEDVMAAAASAEPKVRHIIHEIVAGEITHPVAVRQNQSHATVTA